MKLQEYIGEAIYDPSGQMIFAKTNDGLQQLADIRGWGHIQQLFPKFKDCEKFQDDVGQFIADAINEKVKRDFSNVGTDSITVPFAPCSNTVIK